MTVSELAKTTVYTPTLDETICECRMGLTSTAGISDTIGLHCYRHSHSFI